jgi:hypothetical protein
MILREKQFEPKNISANSYMVHTLSVVIAVLRSINVQSCKSGKSESQLHSTANTAIKIMAHQHQTMGDINSTPTFPDLSRTEIEAVFHLSKASEQQNTTPSDQQMMSLGRQD